MRNRLIRICKTFLDILTKIVTILFTISGTGTVCFHVQKAKKHGILQIAGEE